MDIHFAPVHVILVSPVGFDSHNNVIACRFSLQKEIAESRTTVISSIIEQASLGEDTVVCHSNIPVSGQISIMSQC